MLGIAFTGDDYVACTLTPPASLYSFGKPDPNSSQIQNTENASVNATVGASNNTILPETQQKIELGIQNADAVEAQRLANRSTWEVVQDTSAELFVSAVEMAVDIALEMSPTTWVRRGWIVTKTIRALAKDGWVAAGIEAIKLVPKVGNKLSEGLYNANQEAQILEAFAQGDSEKVQALEEGKYVEKFMDKALGLAIKRLAKNKPTSNPNNTDAADNTNAQPKPTDKLDADQPHTNADELAADEALVAKLAADRAALLANIREALKVPNPPAPKSAKKATRNPAKNSNPKKAPILQQKPAQNPNPTPTQENAENQRLPKSEKVEDPATDIVLTRHQKQQALRNQIGSENIGAFDVYTNTFKNKLDELDAKFLEIETALAENKKILIEANGNLLTRPKMDEAVEIFASLLQTSTNVKKLSDAFDAAKLADADLAQALYNIGFKNGNFDLKTNPNKAKEVFEKLKNKGDAKVAVEKAEEDAKKLDDLSIEGFLTPDDATRFDKIADEFQKNHALTERDLATLDKLITKLEKIAPNDPTLRQDLEAIYKGAGDIDSKRALAEALSQKLTTLSNKVFHNPDRKIKEDATQLAQFRNSIDEIKNSLTRSVNNPLPLSEVSLKAINFFEKIDENGNKTTVSRGFKNCTSCALAVDARLKGDIEAVAKFDGEINREAGATPQELKSLFGNPKISLNVNEVPNIEKQLSSYPSGTTFIIAVQWNNSKDGHAINAMVYRGKVFFYDAQNSNPIIQSMDAWLAQRPVTHCWIFDTRNK